MTSSFWSTPYVIIENEHTSEKNVALQSSPTAKLHRNAQLELCYDVLQALVGIVFRTQISNFKLDMIYLNYSI
jgi:uncharacterized membrane protein YwzB